MKDPNINQLIERFMQGETTPAEEKRLAQWFRTHEVPDEWEPYKAMFAWLDAGMPQSDGLLKDATPEMPDNTSEAQKAPIPSTSPLIVHLWSGHRRWWLSGVAAAAVAFLILAVWPKGSEAPTSSSPVATVQGDAPSSSSMAAPDDSTTKAIPRASQAEPNTTVDDSMPERKSKSHSRYRNYRRFHRQLVHSSNLIAQQQVDSLSRSVRQEVEVAALRQQLEAMALSSCVDSIVEYQQYCLDAALDAQSGEDESQITY
jgi:hypothetical protein